MQQTIKLAALIVVAAIGAFVLRALYVAASRPGPAAPPPTERVRAAAADLPDGLLLRDADLVWKTVPRAQVPPGALVQSAAASGAAAAAEQDDLKGDLLRHAVRAGTPLGAADVISPNAPGFLAAALKPGMRAISVAVDDVSGNAGLIQPGDYVDVLLTQQLAHDGAAAASMSEQRSVEAETIAERVRVLAVGSAFRRPKDDAAAPNTRARTVTFELTPRNAEIVTVGAHLGALSLALRSFATRDRNASESAMANEPPTPPVWGSDVSRALRAVGASASPGNKRAPAVAAAASPRPVIVYRGSKQSEGGTVYSGSQTGAALPPLPTLPALPAEQSPSAPSVRPAA
jgi:pilus assembly protein CpaB